MTGNAQAVVRQIGPLTLSFESSNVEVRERVAALYGAFASVDDATRVPIVVSIEHVADDLAGDDPVAEHWTATVDDVLCRRSPHLALVEDAVTRRINRLVLDAETDRLHLHAGAVAHSEGVVLVVGTSGSGKSTLVTRLVADGWSYLSDEQLGVLEGGQLVPYPRPMTLRRPSWGMLPGLVPDDLDDVIERYEVAPGQVGGVAVTEPAIPQLIVTPDIARGDTDIQRLSAAAGMAALFQDTLDLERAGRAGFDRLVELVTAAPMVRITGTALDATVAAIASELHASNPAPRVEATVVPVADSIVVPTALAWQFSDESAVVYDDESGSLIQLDVPGFAAWTVLASHRAGELPGEAAVSGFVDELRDAGLVRGDAP